MPHRTEFMDEIPADTTVDACREQIRMLHGLTISERAAMTFELSDNLRQIVKDGVRHRHPEWDDTRVRHETFRIVYGDQLYHEVFGGGKPADE